MGVESMLESATTSLLIIEARSNRDLVIGVPHHAPAGQATLPCREHPDADENAGFLGWYLAEKLNCCSVIACNYTVDGNKSLRTDYSMQIAAWSPHQLIEIHGHSGKRAYSNIEISCGSARNNEHSMRLADRLKTAFKSKSELKHLTVCGEYERLYFQAKQAATICGSRWLSYHIELPPELRKPSHEGFGKPRESSYRFCDVLVQALEDIHRTCT